MFQKFFKMPNSACLQQAVRKSRHQTVHACSHLSDNPGTRYCMHAASCQTLQPPRSACKQPIVRQFSRKQKVQAASCQTLQPPTKGNVSRHLSRQEVHVSSLLSDISTPNRTCMQPAVRLLTDLSSETSAQTCSAWVQAPATFNACTSNSP